SLAQEATKVITSAGGRVVGEVRHPLNTPDLSSFLLQAKASKAKIIGLANTPPDNVNAIKLGDEFGIFKGGQQMAGLLVLITDVNALGLQAAQGLLLTTAFYWDLDEQTRAWSKRFFDKLKKMPTMWQAGVYSSVIQYLKAIEATKTDEPLKVIAQMRSGPIEDMFARHGKLREDNLMVHDIYLGQVKKPEDSKYPWDYYQILTTIAGDNAFPPPDPACSLVKQ
ncbi:MAG TPA: ABC transporter substrate-binding protein, partial [Xanthobacteraceae bacterium]|nr:ABC transporter substrate-binding protein [Xanthobacteraceae bacterium]